MSQQTRAPSAYRSAGPAKFAGHAELDVSEGAKVAKDISIVAMAVVVAVIIIVVVSVTLIVRLLRGIVDGAGEIAPTFECAAWLAQRQQSYLAAPGSAGKTYTVCEAAKQAINDAQLAAGVSMCPTRAAPPDVDRQSPYAYYMATQGCASAGA